NIPGLAGSCQANQQISWKAKSRYLASENLVEAVIVAGGGEKAAIACETDCRISGTIFHKAHHELRCKMRCIGCAAAIAANEQLVPGPQTLLDQIGGVGYLRFEVDKRSERLFLRRDCVL